jgi:hypothetical protein
MGKMDRPVKEDPRAEPGEEQAVDQAEDAQNSRRIPVETVIELLGHGTTLRRRLGLFVLDVRDLR